MTTTTTWEWPPGTRPNVKAEVTAILWALHDDGPINATNALAVLRQRLEGKATLSKNATYAIVELAGGRFGRCVTRRTAPGGKRTTFLELELPAEALPPRPPEWDSEPVPAKRMKAVIAGVPDFTDDDDGLEEFIRTRLGEKGHTIESLAVPEPEPEPTAPEEPNHPVPETEPNPEPEPLPAVDDIPAGAVLERLALIGSLSVAAMMDVATLIGRDVPPDDGTARRLADTLEDNAKLRRINRDLEETLRAKVNEVAAVRKALKATQANLDALRTGAQVNDSGFRALDRLMRTPPQPKANGR